MGKGEIVPPGFEAEELKGFSRTVAEIEWLLVILVLLYQVVQGRDDEATVPIYFGLLLYSVFVIGFRYFNIYRTESHWKLAIETWVMIVFITWVLYHSGRLESPLVNLYLLTVITSALTLGKLVTLLEMALIAACYVFLGYSSTSDSLFWVFRAGDFMTQLAPMLLVAYITTMLSADIRGALSRIKVISETDELTGIYNVRAFTALANRTHKQSVRHGFAYSIVMVDSDNLKAINDTYGHEAGNRLLKLTVTCIQLLLRETDVFARYGGDEFVILLPHTRTDGAFEVAERIRKMIAATPLDTRGKQVPTTVSAGIATFPEHGKELAAIMNHADQALYNSKKRGRNCISVSGEQQ
ncbi:MAG: GGDEF domain-containing protein [Betaproteobacteria bacterium]|nr:GGDEF domain-containing protein [Betaproteobacteria bacterium]